MPKRFVYYKAILGFLIFLATGITGAQSGPWRISGRVFSMDGKPAAGVRVAAMAAPDSVNPPLATPVVASTVSNPYGVYSLELAKPGRYYVVAGNADSPTYYPGVSALDAATAIPVGHNTYVGSDFDFSLGSTGFKVSGRVVGATNLPASMENYRVRLIAQKASDDGVRIRLRAPLRLDGSFEFPKVLPGTYECELEPRHSGTTTRQSL